MTVETDGEWLTIPVAALRLNLSVDAVRRRLKAGQLRGRRVRGQHGPRWEVRLDGPPPSGPAEARPTDGEHPRRGGVDEQRWLELMRELLAENGELSRQLGRLGDERAELYGRCGYLQGQLAAAQAQILALRAPATAAAAEGTARRSWWRVLSLG